MNTAITIETERVDDIPMLVANMNKMGIEELVDAVFAVHGNWQRINLGQVVTGWLAYILSEADHRLNHVRSWAEKRPQTLRACLGSDVEGRISPTIGWRWCWIS